jgi:regulator of CtrA degradation
VLETKEPLSFGHAYAQSDTFQALFKEGMQLVEETASYLDGDGRAAARGLRRAASIVYATESMRLTTRLMQLASWLLLHRSVREGEMTQIQAQEEKRKIKLETTPSTDLGGLAEELPEEFAELIHRSIALQKRVERIDAALFDTAPTPETNPVSAQLEVLAAAFARR